jgi:predicted nucleic acid-binding protein
VLVLDASAAIEAVLQPGGVREELADAHLFAPTLIDIEFVSAMRRLALSKELTATAARAKISIWQQLEIERVDVVPFIDAIWELRHNLSAYDASYVALAKYLDAPLLTRDLRMAAAAKQHCRVITDV